MDVLKGALKGVLCFVFAIIAAVFLFGSDKLNIINFIGFLFFAALAAMLIIPQNKKQEKELEKLRGMLTDEQAVYHLNLRDIEIEDLQECIDDCPHGRRTKENMRALCGLIYKYAIPRHYAELNYGQYLNVDGKHSSRPGLPDDALPKLKAHVNDVFGASYVICQCYLGYRPTEFVALDASQYIRAERAFINGIKTEAGIDRIVTISPKIQPYIDALLPPGKTSGAVFVDKDNKAFTVERYRALFYNVLEACGIDNPTQERDGKTFYTYTPHSCRHTFATLMKRVKGADKDKLELIGHTSDDMLRYYQDVNYADLRKITDAL